MNGFQPCYFIRDRWDAQKSPAVLLLVTLLIPPFLMVPLPVVPLVSARSQVSQITQMSPGTPIAANLRFLVYVCLRANQNASNTATHCSCKKKRKFKCLIYLIFFSKLSIMCIIVIWCVFCFYCNLSKNHCTQRLKHLVCNKSQILVGKVINMCLIKIGLPELMTRTTTESIQNKRVMLMLTN